MQLLQGDEKVVLTSMKMLCLAAVKDLTDWTKVGLGQVELWSFQVPAPPSVMV